MTRVSAVLAFLVLKQLVEERARMITTEAAVVAFPKGTLAEWAREIPALDSGDCFAEPEKVGKLLEAAFGGKGVRLLGRGEVTSLSSRRVHTASLKEESYVHDYEPQMSSSACMFDPVIGVLFSGFLLDVRSTFGLEPGQVIVDLRESGRW